MRPGHCGWLFDEVELTESCRPASMTSARGRKPVHPPPTVALVGVDLVLQTQPKVPKVPEQPVAAGGLCGPGVGGRGAACLSTRVDVQERLRHRGCSCKGGGWRLSIARPPDL
mmetsp:Transcript_60544/g.131201  ORF Transcript_60544/g.131201 Transcript_60544/m.131201 type:complete len:113 (+) Transcript_60544:201-539(+)